MSPVSLLAVFLVGLCSWQQPALAQDVDESDVLVLTKDNFDDTLRQHKYVLVEFYAPWCGHCKRLTPNYAQAATRLKAELDADVVLAKVDATEQKDLATRFGVNGYPMLKWFIKGNVNEYNGPREADGIISWVKRRAGPSTTQVQEVAQLQQLEADAKAPVVVGWFEDLTGEDADTYRTVAGMVDGVTFVETTSKEVAALAGLTAPGVAAIKNEKGEPRSTSRFALNADALKAWASTEKIPLLVDYDNDNLELIFRSGVKKQLMLWAPGKDLQSGNAAYDAFRAVAAKFRGQLVFVRVDMEGVSLSKKISAMYNLENAQPPVVLGLYMEANKKYVMDMSQPVTEAALEAFAKGVVDGTATPHYKSQAPPENPKDGGVTVVVGTTVDAIVMDDSKDVLLEVYAPWCGHCKALAPAYEELAKRFSQVESVVIAKMDGTENEHAKLKVQGYPTLFFKPAGSSTLLQYSEAGRTVEDLTKFIKKNAKVAFTLPEESASAQAGKHTDKTEL